MYLQNLLSALRGSAERLWAYLGTLAAMSLMLGTLGMGIYHILTGNNEAARVECFRGVFNSAGAEPPRGTAPLPSLPAAAMGCPHMRFEYGEDGRLVRVLHTDAQGQPCTMPGSRVAEQRLDYDAAGRLIRKANVDLQGMPVPDASGVPVRAFEYDKEGRLVSTRFLDGEGRGIVPRMPGYATARTRYDAKGRPLSIDYLDGEGKPIVNAEGESRIEYMYDDARHSSQRSNRVNGELADNAKGYAIEHRQHSEDGRTLILRWVDAQGNPALVPGDAASALLREYDAEGQVCRERFCCGDGGMVQDMRQAAEHLVRRSPDGSVAWERYNAADGQPCTNPALGYAERLVEYGPDDRPERELFWDEEGNPAPCYEKRHIESAGEPSVLSLHTDGSTEIAVP